MTLLVPRELDRLLRYPRGRSQKLAKAGKLPFVQLPDGEIRFDERAIVRHLKIDPAVQVETIFEGEVVCAR